MSVLIQRFCGAMLISFCSLSHGLAAEQQLSVKESLPANPRDLNEALRSIGSLLESNDFDEWQRRSSDYQLIVLSAFDANNPEFHPFRPLFPPWSAKLARAMPNDSFEGSRERLAWEVTRLEYLKNKSDSKSHQGQLDGLDFPSADAVKTAISFDVLLWLLSVLFAGFGGVIAWSLYSRKRSQDAALNVPSRQIFDGEMSPGSAQNRLLLLGLLEYHLNASVVLSALAEMEGWKELTGIQKIICHLTFRGVRAAEISEYFGYSKGHYYNERSTIRKKLGVPPDKDLNPFLKKLVDDHAAK